MEGQKASEVDIADAISVREIHGPAGSLQEVLGPAPSLSELASVHEVDPPVFKAWRSEVQVSRTKIDRKIGHSVAVVDEEVLDHFPLVAQGKEELLAAVTGIMLHDVP
jgi:P2-related tail formation protein